ncbi:hypothetical protein CKM354_000021700 [Cercospora kikuchii]|uniref:Secreted protein n=1 Tax=Cercospora kikuchii TaxID=84275 RepID=A0A9P3FBN2_9PEZI|nr:uncharacterized protein CKM354_000021700 [Cercospora kikuchii]GIZ36750.1 hypothetical protein CKM354_000021700 [Cercospora kikuchii]
MLFSTHLLRAVLAVLPLTAALPGVSVGIEEGIEGYEIEPMQWEVRAFSDGPLIPMNGTVQEVVVKLRDLNPQFDESIALDHDAPQKRADAAAVSHACYSRWDYLAATKYINDGIRYLRNIRGSPRIGPGPGKCSRVSCSYNSAIWWCNDNRVGIGLFSFASIADGAQYLVDRCQSKAFGIAGVSGRVFHSAGWNVVVQRDTC